MTASLLFPPFCTHTFSQATKPSAITRDGCNHGALTSSLYWKKGSPSVREMQQWNPGLYGPITRRPLAASVWLIVNFFMFSLLWRACNLLLVPPPGSAFASMVRRGSQLRAPSLRKSSCSESPWFVLFFLFPGGFGCVICETHHASCFT